VNGQPQADDPDGDQDARGGDLRQRLHEARARLRKREKHARLYYFPVALLALVMQGSMVAAMWGWFIVPLGVSPLSHAHAMGILLLAEMLAKYHRADYAAAVNSTVLRSVGFEIMTTAGFGLYTLLAWGIHSWWM